MKRMILFGGSFNPVHLGHLWMAQAALETLGAEQVVFMPTGDSPHKSVETLARHRAEMVRLACGSNEGFVFSDYELNAPQPSYTIRTVQHFLAEDPDRKIFLLIGEDSLLQFHKWKDYRTLLGLVTLAVAPRLHGLSADTGQQEARLRALGGKIHRIPMPRIELSSTAVRRRARLGRTLANQVPEAALAYLKTHRLYRDTSLDPLLSDLRTAIGRTRFEHSLRVAETAERLALLHGEDSDRALLAGLLHDAAKGREEALLEDERIAGAFQEQDEAKALWHTYLGPLAAQFCYGITDAQVLGAMRAHTTGEPGMSNLAKILFIADKTEPGRPDPINADLLTLAEQDLDEGFYQVLRESIEYLDGRKMKFHPKTRALYQTLQKERQFDRKNGFDSEDPSR